MFDNDLEEKLGNLESKVENLEREKELLIKHAKMMIELVNNYEELIDTETPGRKLKKDQIFKENEAEISVDLERIESHIDSLEFKVEQVYEEKLEEM